MQQRAPRLPFLAFLIFAGAPVVQCAPVITSVANAASNIVPGLPNSAIAQGAIFLLFGSGLGPSNLIVASNAFQSSALSGTSAKITVKGTSVDALMYYTSDGQVAALLPSNTPTGTGTIAVTYNSSTSSPSQITVTGSNVGIFTVSSNGQGPGIVTYADYSLVSANKAANAGDTLSIWATGVGPITGSDAAGSGLGVDMTNVPVTVWLGGVQAPVVYRGRSGCCIGEDQVVFTVPASVPLGCAVPLAVQVNGITSNFAALPVASGSRVCSMTNPALSSVNVEQLVAAGPLTYAAVALSKDIPGPNAAITDGANLELAKILTYGPGSLPFYATYLDSPPGGTCTVYNNTSPSNTPPIVSRAVLDIGPSFSLTGPNGAQTLNTSHSSMVLSPAGTYLTPGNYTLTGTGGADAGGFSVTATMPPASTPAIKASSLATRSTGATVTWTGGASNPNAYVEVQVQAATDSTGANGATATCFAQVSSGSLTIPPYVMMALPPTNFGSLVFLQGVVMPFTAKGLGIGSFSILNTPSIVQFMSQ